MKVMIIPEDPVTDQYILKPIVEQMFADLGKRCRVYVLSNPRLRGVAQALDSMILTDIVETNPMMDLFLVLVDRDGDAEKRPIIAQHRMQEHQGRVFVCLAVEEVEVWMLALHRQLLDVSWHEVRAERDPKERFAHGFLATHSPRLTVGGGRVWAMREVGAKWRGLLEVCPELAELRQQIATWLRV